MMTYTEFDTTVTLKDKDYPEDEFEVNVHVGAEGFVTSDSFDHEFGTFGTQSYSVEEVDITSITDLGNNNEINWSDISKRDRKKLLELAKDTLLGQEEEYIYEE